MLSLMRTDHNAVASRHYCNIVLLDTTDFFSTCFSVSRELPGPKLTVEQFVNKLPKTVIRNGNIVNIRESIAEQLTGIVAFIKLQCAYSVPVRI